MFANSSYTLFDSTISLFAENDDRSVGDQIFVGEKNSLEITETWQIESYSHGQTHRRRRVGEISYSLNLSGVLQTQMQPDSGGGWSFLTHGGYNQWPGPEPGQRYFLVVVYECPETGSWIKETFSGVQGTGRSWRSSGEQFDLDTPMLADFVHRETFWGGSRPSITPEITGRLIYVNGGTRIEMFSYDFISKSFTDLSNFDGANMNAGASVVPDHTSWYLQISGEIVCRINDQGVLEVADFQSDGDYAALSGARIEFRFGSKLFAAVDAAGRFVTGGLYEKNNPLRQFDFEILDIASVWLASIDQKGVFVESIEEVSA
jgi:hypothetical protein